MQLSILLRKDLKTLFKQKAVIFTLFIPFFMIVGLGLLPTLIGINEPFEVGYLVEDEGTSDLQLANLVMEDLQQSLNNDKNIEFLELNSFDEFFGHENAIWFPSNFSKVAELTKKAIYYLKISDSDLRANSVMNGIIVNEIENIIIDELLVVELPQVKTEQIFSEESDIQKQSQVQIAFPLAYMSFLILILSSSSMRITGFSAEREAGMMELLLSSIVNRRELVLSKLITGVVYGLASVTSYILGIVFVYLLQGSSTSTQETAFLILPPELLNPFSIGIIFLLFADLSFISIQILLSAQLALGREAGDRLGSMAMMILAFMFYFSSIGDPLSETGAKIINPFFWPFRISLNILFGIDLPKTLMYLGLNLWFSLYLLRLKTRSIEKEKVLFE